MILSSQTIRRRVLDRDDKLYIEPFCERCVIGGMSFGLSSCGYDIRIKDTVRVEAGDFVLATTIERIVMPNDLKVTLYDKSTWARQGLSIQNTIFEPGWEGYPTLELSLHKAEGFIEVQAGYPVGQLCFELLDLPTEQPYKGKYQDQPQQPVLPMFED